MDPERAMMKDPYRKTSNRKKHGVSFEYVNIRELDFCILKFLLLAETAREFLQN